MSSKTLLIVTLLILINNVHGFTFLGNLKVPQLQDIKNQMDADKKFGKKKICVITGTSSGLGRHTTKQLLKDGKHHLILSMSIYTLILYIFSLMIFYVCMKIVGRFHVIGAVRDLDKMAAIAEADGFNMEVPLLFTLSFYMA